MSSNVGLADVIPIALFDTDFGEQTAQAGENVIATVNDLNNQPRPTATFLRCLHLD
jgi:hypothetical protein